MCDIDAIKSYILFLKEQCGLSVTLHPMKKENLIIPTDLITFNLHDSSYCLYVKTFPQVWRHCIECQQKVHEKCGGGSFCGTCYAGVTEYVYPIVKGGGTVGFISVSGYRSEKAQSYLERMAARYSIPVDNLTATYFSSLKENMPVKTEIDTLLIPLCQMLELAYIKNEGEGEEHEGLIDRVVRYIKRYHTQNLTLEDICHHFFCSRSHISHLFKKQTGRTVREFLTDIRLNDARMLLRHSELSVTEIALSVGFGNSNYFSAVFKKSEGMSPIAYRRAGKLK